MKQFFKFLFASILGFFISSVLVIVFFISMISVVGTKSNDTVVADNSVLVFDLQQVVLERPSYNFSDKIGVLGGKENKVLTLNALLSAIKKAKSDSQIKGIFIKGSFMSTPGLATFEEIHDALNDFKASKKFVIAYSDQYNLAGYYLASTAQQIYLNPVGGIDFKGLSASIPFFKNVMDKLGVEAQIIRVGKYKSAVEPFILNEMSAANREQTTVFLNSLHQNILKDISESRKIAIDSLQQISNQHLIRSAQDAVTYRLVNSLKYTDEVLDILKKQLKLAKDKTPNTISMNEYAKTLDTFTEEHDDKVAIVYVNGEIINANTTEGSSGNIVKALRKAREDEDVKAIVLRVNSPGGDALASDIIWREVSLIRQAKKPIYVSMGDYAASGGYYVSCKADMIFAQPNTITGSIGVFGILPNVQKLLKDKIGVNVDVVKTGEYSDMGALYRPLTEAERNILQTHVNEFYSTFIRKVAEGRNKSEATIDSIASGRVWSGTDALRIGLVDKIGSFEQTIAAVAAKAKLKDYEIVEYQKSPNILEVLLKESTESVKMSLLKKEMGELYPYYNQIKALNNSQGVMARMPLDVQIQY